MESSGWDGPVEVDYGFDLYPLRQAMVRGYDQSGIGTVSGDLRNKIEDPGGWTVKLDSAGNLKEAVLRFFGIPYARIQDQGGSTGKGGRALYHTSKKYGPAMAFVAGDGSFVVTRKAKAAILPGFDYTSQGIQEVEEDLGIIFKAKWKREKNG